MRRLVAFAAPPALTPRVGCLAFAQDLANRPGSVKFAVIGDNGTGERPEYEVAQQMAAPS